MKTAKGHSIKEIGGTRNIFSLEELIFDQIEYD
jgi:hypothetical protein